MSICLSALGENRLFSEMHSHEYIIRWAFQDICDHVFDPRTIKWAWPTSTEPGGVRFNPDEVKCGDIIFVRDIDLFMKEMDPLIRFPYLIVTHGEYRDTCMEYHLAYLENPQIIAWFSIHPPKMGHIKFFPIPLGIKQEKQYYEDMIGVNAYLAELRREIPKSKLLYMNFDCEQNPERAYLKAFLKDKKFCSYPSGSLPFFDYLRDMAQYKFVLSPRGWGPDCYRTWEALYVGSIPVVRRCQFDQMFVRGVNVACNRLKLTFTSLQNSQLDTLYKDLPILVVDEWEELTEEFLNKKYEEITSKKYDMSKLSMSYWYNEIYTIRDKFLESNCAITEK